MRYQNWDVLLFPERSKIPLQEFKTSCHVIQDQETLHPRNNAILLPTVTSFVRALPAGQPFRISVHCWEDPEPSRYSQNFIKNGESIMFEARVIIDGRLVGYLPSTTQGLRLLITDSARVFERGGPWPAIIETSLGMDKNGEMESLAFPAFHRELLTQSYWNAGDELGRIKVVIAEGFPRDSTSMTLDRIKNVVAFSFQHAPIDILEASSIAWPNAVMWRQASFINTPYFLMPISPKALTETEGEAHSHSPRHKDSVVCRALPPPIIGHMLPPSVPMFGRSVNQDPFTDPANHWRQGSSADVSMPDYSTSSVSRASHSRRVTDPMMTERADKRFETLQSVGAFESICEALLPAAPGNSPRDSVSDKDNNIEADQVDSDLIRQKYGTGNTHQLPVMNSTIAGIRSRKENMQEPLRHSEDSSTEASRKPAQAFNSSGSGLAKRQRIVTPAAFKVIDEEDGPRDSSTSKVSQLSQPAAAPEGERRVLSTIEQNAL